MLSFFKYKNLCNSNFFLKYHIYKKKLLGTEMVLNDFFLFIYEDVMHTTMLKKWKKNISIKICVNLKKRLILFSQLILQSFSNFRSLCCAHRQAEHNSVSKTNLYTYSVLLLLYTSCRCCLVFHLLMT